MLAKTGKIILPAALPMSHQVPPLLAPAHCKTRNPVNEEKMMFTYKHDLSEADGLCDGHFSWPRLWLNQKNACLNILKELKCWVSVFSPYLIRQ